MCFGHTSVFSFGTPVTVWFSPSSNAMRTPTDEREAAEARFHRLRRVFGAKHSRSSDICSCLHVMANLLASTGPSRSGVSRILPTERRTQKILNIGALRSVDEVELSSLCVAELCTYVSPEPKKTKFLTPAILETASNGYPKRDTQLDATLRPEVYFHLSLVWHSVSVHCNICLTSYRSFGKFCFSSTPTSTVIRSV